MQRKTLIHIKKLRKILGVTQIQLAKLMNVHFMTISKWEREVIYPSTWQFLLLMQLSIAACRKPGIGGRVIVNAEENRKGIIYALYRLLELSYRVELPDDVKPEDVKLITRKEK